jgi:solute:Na+ symporter, SSS family
MDSPQHNPLGLEWLSLVMGLGFVVSFGYWCTDFLVVQRAMAADSMSAARRTPLIAAFPKMLFPFLVILPGLIALALSTPAAHAPAPGGPDPAPQAAVTPPPARAGTVETAAAEVSQPAKVVPAQAGTAEPGATQTTLLPAQINERTGQVVRDKDGRVVLDYNMVIPNMLLHYFPAGMLGLGLTALLASFMSGMAGNVTAFNTVWTYDIYQSYIRKHESDEHYLRMAHFATVGGILLSIAAAYFASAFNNIMDILQLVFAFVNAPLLATFLLGMFWKRTTGHGAFYGLLIGTAAAALHHGLTLPAESVPGLKGGWIHVVNRYPSEMAQNFWTAIFAWVTCFIVTILISLLTKPRKDEELKGLVYSLTEKDRERGPWYTRPVPVGLVILAMALVLNVIFF